LRGKCPKFVVNVKTTPAIIGAESLDRAAEAADIPRKVEYY